MSWQSFLNSSQAGAIALVISRSIPPELGQRLSCSLADRIANRKDLPLVRAVRANQWMIAGQSLTQAQLDQATRETLRCTAHSFYTLFHNLQKPQAMQSLVNFDPRAEEIIRLSQTGERGVIVAGLHLSNFDLVAMAAANRGIKALAITLNEVKRGIQWQHRLRRKAGLEVLPASVAVFHQAVRRLKAGECLITGIDHPLADCKRCPDFYGYPASLPTHHIRLALQANVPVVVMAAVLHPDGIYHTLSSDYIEMKHYPDREDDILCNAERVLEIAAGFIAQAPTQWAVFQPVWPQTEQKAP